MTEKRFYIQDERTIKDNKRYITENGYMLSFKYDAEELCDLLNTLVDENERLKQQLQEIENDFEVEWTQNYEEIDKDKLYIKDKNTKILLDGLNLFIEVYIPPINEYYRYKYRVIGRNLMREFIENYNLKEDME